MNKHTAVVLLCSVTIQLVFSGCASTNNRNHRYFMKTKSDASVYVDAQPPAVRKVAIMPFTASTELIGSSVSELFVTELLKSGFYTLVERSQMSKYLSETELSASGMTSSRAVEIGTLLGADGVILGTVDQYEAQAYKGKTYPIVGVTLRLIDCETGRIGWSVDLAKKSKKRSDALATFSREVVHEMMSGLYKELSQYSAPNDPVNVSVKCEDICESIISWNKKADKKAKYIIERSASSDGDYVEVGDESVSKGKFTDEDLEYNTQYFYRVTAEYKNGVRSKTVGPVDATTPPLPSQVNEFTAESGLVRTVPLTWSAPTESSYVKGYEIHRSEGVGSYEKLKFIKGAESCSYLDGGEEPGKLDDNSRYSYKIYAVDERGGMSALAAETDAMTRAQPPVVANVMAVSDSPREIPLVWDESTDVKVDGYYIERSDDNAGWKQIADITSSDTTDYVDRGGERKADRLGRLLDDHKYSYRVAAYNVADVRSEWSKSVTAMTKKCPSMPSSPRCSSDLEKMIQLEWTPNAENDVAHYIVEVCKNGDGKYSECGKAEEASFTHTDLDDGVEYAYRVQVVDKDGLRSVCSVCGEGSTKSLPSDAVAQ